MTIEEAKEILEMVKECNNRKEACKWFCEICEFGQYNRDEKEEAFRVLGVNEDAFD